MLCFIYSKGLIKKREEKRRKKDIEEEQ